MIRFWGLILAFFWIAPTAGAQSNCNKNLIDAENFYQAGRLYAIPERLESCLESGFNREEKINAYRLLALTFLNINQEEKAREAFHELLKINPDYRVMEGIDPQELYNLFTKFNTEPIYYLGGFAGVNYTLPYVLNSRSFSSIAQAAPKNYSPALGLQAGFDFTYPITRQIHLESRLGYRFQSYRFISNITTNLLDEQSSIQAVSGSENYHLIALMINLAYDIPTNNDKLKVKIGAGISPDYLFYANYRNLERINLIFATDNITNSSIESIAYRHQYNLSTQLFAGAEYKIGQLFFGVRAGIQSAIFTHTSYNDLHNYYFNPISLNYAIVDDDYILQSIYLEFSIKKPFYQFLK